MKVKYYVSGMMPTGDDLGSFYHGNEAESAVRTWFKQNRKYPTCICTLCKTKEDGVELLRWAQEHLEELKADYGNKCCYSLDYMANSIAKGIEGGCDDVQWKYDMLDPFSLG